jgi:hypothetical protein
MTTVSSQDAGSAKTERGSGAAIFLVAMGLALATTSGAILTAAGTGGLQDAVRNLSAARAADTVAEQLQQTATIARLENDVRALIDEVSDLKARPHETPAVGERLGKLDAGLAQLRTETAQLRADTSQVRTETVRLKAETGRLKSETEQLRSETGQLRAAQGESAASGAWRDQVGELKASLAQAGIDIDAMRSSLDGSDHAHRKAIVDIDRRVDRLEHMIAAEVTGAFGAQSPRRRAPPGQRRSLASHGLTGWSVQEAQDGAAKITGYTGTYEVTSGTFVPGIGRVSGVHQRANRWIVETEKGTIVQR